MQVKSYDTIKEEIRDDFINFYKEHYEKKEIPRKQLAEDLHILPQTVSDILNKKQYISLEVIISFQLYHPIPFDWILYKGSFQKLAL